MRVFHDYDGRRVTLTDSSEGHIIVRHPEVAVIGLDDALRETLASPDVVIYRGRAYHFFRMRHSAPYINKYVKVVVEAENGDLYVRTAYPTGRLTGGTVVWKAER